MLAKFKTIILGISKFNFTPFVIGALAIALATAIYCGTRPKPPVIIHEPGGTTVVQVDKPVITTKDVIKYVKDEKEVSILLAENSALKTRVSQLTESVGSSTSTGSGTITPPTAVTTTVSVPLPIVFQDYRLAFSSPDGKQVFYKLNQKFEVLSTTGLAEDGHPTATVKLFEIGPESQRTAIPVVTTVVAAAPGAAHWNLSLGISAGFGLTSGPNRAIIVGTPWLTRERTSAPKDRVFSIATPAIMVGAIPGERVLNLGILPVSYNLGSLPHNPLSNIWVSPLLAWNGKLIIGGAVTANF